jgi:Flp pilus assembly protein protease CpaA
MNVALFALALPICIADLSTFVIPNIYTKILFYLTLIHLSLFGFGQLRDVVVSLAALLLLILLGIGMGDVKLLALILLSHSFNAPEYIAFAFLLGLLHIVILTGIHRAIPSKIALAPSIFIGLATYLAAR